MICLPLASFSLLDLFQSPGLGRDRPSISQFLLVQGAPDKDQRTDLATWVGQSIKLMQPTRSQCKYTWLASQHLHQPMQLSFVWHCRLLFASVPRYLNDPRPTPSSGTPGQASRFPQTSMILMGLLKNQAPSPNSRASPKVSELRVTATSFGHSMIQKATCVSFEFQPTMLRNFAFDCFPPPASFNHTLLKRSLSSRTN